MPRNAKLIGPAAARSDLLVVLLEGIHSSAVEALRHAGYTRIVARASPGHRCANRGPGDAVTRSSGLFPARKIASRTPGATETKSALGGPADVGVVPHAPVAGQNDTWSSRVSR